MGRQIQVPHHCAMFQPSENLNLTCTLNAPKRTRCKVYNEEYCNDYCKFNYINWKQLTEKEEANAGSVSKNLRTQKN